MKPNFTSEDVINSLEGIQKAEPLPFLYTRVQARLMQEQNRPEIAIFRFVTRPLFAVCFAIIFILVNGYLVNLKMKDTHLSEEVSQPIAAEYVQYTVNPYEITEMP